MLSRTCIKKKLSNIGRVCEREKERNDAETFSLCVLSKKNYEKWNKKEMGEM